MEEFEIPRVFFRNKRPKDQSLNIRKVSIKEHSTCLSTMSRPQLMNSSTLVVFALLCKKLKMKYQLKLGALNTKKQFLLCLNEIKRKVDFSSWLYLLSLSHGSCNYRVREEETSLAFSFDVQGWPFVVVRSYFWGFFLVVCSHLLVFWGRLCPFVRVCARCLF